MLLDIFVDYDYAYGINNLSFCNKGT